MKAVISRQPYNRYIGLPDEIETIDITNCLVVINHLSQMAKLVNQSPNAEYGMVAQQMAYLISQIEMALEPQLTQLNIKLKEEK